MSTEAPAEGTSTKCTESTTVILECVLHEMQNWPQNSLLLTLRLPIEGEPNRCKQEVADSVVTAGHTNEMVKTAKSNELDMDVDGKTTLGRELAGMVHRVDKGGKECESKSQLQLETNLLCRGICQCSKNKNKNVPIANGLPLKGEWTVCASSELGNSSEGCNRGASESASIDSCQWLHGTDSNPGQAVERGDAPNKLIQLLRTTVKLYVSDGDMDTSICLGGTQMQLGDTDGPGRGTDMLKGLLDGSGAQTDTPNVLNNTEIDCMSHGEGLSTYLGVGGPKCRDKEADDSRTHMDMSYGSVDVPSIETNLTKPANETERISMRQTEAQMKNSPETFEIATPKPIRQWRKVSVGNGEVYVPLNMPIAVPS